MISTYLYKKDGMPTTVINVDYVAEAISIENLTDNVLDTAFGVTKNPTFADFEEFLESRCFPRNVSNMHLHLKELGLDFYDPYAIVARTNGVLEGDSFSLNLVNEE